MIDRVYIHNYRCLENFTLTLAGRGSLLVIGKNGAGKSSLRRALAVLQSIGRGPNRVKEWVGAGDFTRDRRQVPMRFEVDLALGGRRLRYAISFSLPDKFREPRVEEEQLSADGVLVFTRRHSQVDQPDGRSFGLDWHVAALPVIQERPGEGVVRQVKAALASLLLLAPVPSQMHGFAEDESAELDSSAGNLSAWLNGLLLRHPAAYRDIDAYLREVMSDFDSFENRPRGEVGTSLLVRFSRGNPDETLTVPFGSLSDGEKCFFLAAAVAAAAKRGDPLFCFWDEPDNHLSLAEVGHFVTHLRRLANHRGQFVATSHHPETVRRFSAESTVVLTRGSHLEPTVVRELADVTHPGDLVEALKRGEVMG